ASEGAAAGAAAEVAGSSWVGCGSEAGCVVTAELLAVGSALETAPEATSESSPVDMAALSAAEGASPSVSCSGASGS
ncbi:hypothetical protein, partial [Aeromonas hydrophila]|uniref:hypothetical protein n=1 Tax=Aeromonas hydrophila TaxID=644 RepID=UPI0036DC7277